MPPQVGQREGANRDCQRIERGGWTVVRRFAGQHAGDIDLQRHRLDRVAAAAQEDAYSQGSAFHILRTNLEPGTLNQKPGDESRCNHPHAGSPRKRCIPFHMFGRLAMSWWSSSMSDRVTFGRASAKRCTVRESTD